MNSSAAGALRRRLVVLGHNGFIGRRLCDALRARHADVELIGLALDGFDLTSDSAADSLAARLDASDTVVVLAGIKKQLGDSAELFRRNLAIASAVCTAIERQPVGRVVFFSSAEVYGEYTGDTEMTELTPVRPTSYYGIAKFASEGLIRKAAAASKASHVILRPPLVYGPGDPSASYGPSGFSRAAVRGQAITLWGDGAERRDFLFIDDLVEVTCRLIFSEVQGVVNVATGESLTFREVLDAIGRLIGRPLVVETRPRSRASVDQGYRIDRLRAALPDVRFTLLEDGLRAVIQAERAAVASGDRR